MYGGSGNERVEGLGVVDSDCERVERVLGLVGGWRWVEYGKACYEALKQSERLKRVKNVMESRKCMYDVKKW